MTQTLIVFSGDNGGWMSANGTAGGNNYPLAGGKYSTFAAVSHPAVFLWMFSYDVSRTSADPTYHSNFFSTKHQTTGRAVFV